MKPIFALALILLLATANVSTASAEPIVASKPWVVDFAEQQCVASREYGADGRYVLALKPSPGGDIMQLTILVDGSGSNEAQEISGKVTIDDRPPVDLRMLVYKARDQKIRLHRINLTMDEFAPLRTARRLSIDAGRHVDADFVLTQMPDLTSKIDACLADLRQHWHVAEPAVAKIATFPIGDIRGVFGSAAYPGISMSRSDGGEVRAMLLVDETGKIADCIVTETSRVPALDAQTCAIIQKRAKFEPARGGDGKPMRAYVNTPPIVWRVR